jgi:hypothetical protein
MKGLQQAIHFILSCEFAGYLFVKDFVQGERRTLALEFSLM